MWLLDFWNTILLPFRSIIFVPKVYLFIIRPPASSPECPSQKFDAQMSVFPLSQSGGEAILTVGHKNVTPFSSCHVDLQIATDPGTVRLTNKQAFSSIWIVSGLAIISLSHHHINEGGSLVYCIKDVSRMH